MLEAEQVVDPELLEKLLGVRQIRFQLAFVPVLDLAAADPSQLVVVDGVAVEGLIVEDELGDVGDEPLRHAHQNIVLLRIGLHQAVRAAVVDRPQLHSGVAQQLEDHVVNVQLLGDYLELPGWEVDPADLLIREAQGLLVDVDGAPLLPDSERLRAKLPLEKEFLVPRDPPVVLQGPVNFRVSQVVAAPEFLELLVVFRPEGLLEVEVPGVGRLRALVLPGQFVQARRAANPPAEPVGRSQVGGVDLEELPELRGGVNSLQAEVAETLYNLPPQGEVVDFLELQVSLEER